MAKHRQHDADLLPAKQQYEQLMQTLHTHSPGHRSGLCLACGVGWPCTEVWLPLVHGHISDKLR